MKKVHILWAVLSVCICGGVYLVALPHSPRIEKRFYVRNLPPKAVDISISTDKKVYLWNEPIPLNITIVNKGPDSLERFGRWSEGYYPYTFKARDSKGLDYPLTNFGRKYEEIKSRDYMDLNGSGPIEIDTSPGIKLTHRVFLSQYVDFSSFEYNDGPNVFVEVQRYGQTSNTLPITISYNRFDLKDPYVRKRITIGQ